MDFSLLNLLSEIKWREGIFLALAVVNVIVFFMYAIDKYKARHHKWRIPESTLLLGAVFGTAGAILGMLVMHHKTRKPKFFITVPLILIGKVGIVLWYYLNFIRKG